MEILPILLPLRGRSVLLVGGGELALRKARLLARLACRLVVVAPELEAHLEDLATEIRRRDFRDSDLDGQALAFAATSDPALAQRVSEAATARHIPVNVPDRPELSSFQMPAIIDRDPIVVAIGSGGASPLLTRALRARIEAFLEPGLGRLARFLGQFRATIKATRPDADSRRRFWEGVLSGPISWRFLAGDETGAFDALVQAVNRTDADPAGGQVALVGAGPGDPDLLTLRALRLLQAADVIVHDKLVDDRVLDYARRDARRIFVGKQKSNHSIDQREIEALLIREARAGHRVVRLKGGDPFIFGRGGEEIAALRAANVPVEIVPGVTAAIGCGAAVSIPMTQRGLADGVTFVTGHSVSGEPKLDWPALAKLDHTLVVYMGLSTAATISRRLIDAGRDAETPVALIENGTRPDQSIVVGTLAQLPQLAAGRKGPALIVIGEVVRLADPSQLGADARRLAG